MVGKKHLKSSYLFQECECDVLLELLDNAQIKKTIKEAQQHVNKQIKKPTNPN